MKGDKVTLSTAKDVFYIYGGVFRINPWLITFSILGVLGIQAANLGAPLYLRKFFNLLAQSTPGAEAAALLLQVLGVVALWWAAQWVANRFEHFINVFVVAGGMAHFENKAFAYLIDHSHNFFISNFSGSLTHKVNKFAKAFQVAYEASTLTVLPTIVFAIGAVVVLFLHNHILGLALAAWVVLFVLFQIQVTRWRQPLRKLRAEADTRITGTLADAIGNQNTISLFSGGTYEKARFAAVVEEWRRAGIKAWIADAFIWSGIGLFLVTIQIGMLWGAVVLWKQGLLTIGDFVLIQAYLLTLFERLLVLQQDLRRIFDAVADGGEMVEILATRHEIRDRKSAKPLAVSGGEVWFDNVNFYFNKLRPVLKDFNLTIAGGERVALVGPSGAGKSTVTKLLLRLYDLPEGEIKIDKQDISKVTQESLRNAISFVPQEPILFHRTLMENIRYGRRDASDEEVIEAAKKAHCHEFISELQHGYDTYVGERGVKLSGGERQRVAIARAILKNAPILVLDEATSSLDSESEALIQDALETLMEGKTVIVIAHRLSTIMKMDRIVVMEQGKIIAQGTHLQLIKERGLYQKLWSIQAGGFLGDGGSDDEEATQLDEEVDEDLLADAAEEE